MFSFNSETRPRKRRGLQIGAALALASALALAPAVTATGHTGDADAMATCAAPDYATQVELTLASVPSGVTATVEVHTNAGAFQHGWDRSTFTGWTTVATNVPDTQSLVSWTADPIPGTTVGNGPWYYIVTTFSNGVVVKSDTRVEGLLGDCVVPATPSITVTPTGQCDAVSTEYSVLYEGSANNIGGNTKVVVSVSSASPAGSLINGQSGTVELYGTGTLPDLPVGGTFSYLQTGIPGTATSASTVLTYTFSDGTTATLTPTVTLAGDCEPPVVWEVCTATAAPTTSYDMGAYTVTDIRNTGVGEINDDQPRSGFGSLMLHTPANADKVQYVMPVTPFPLNELTQLEYETYRSSVYGPGVAMGSLQLRFTSVSKGLTGDFNFIAYEPYIDQGNAAIVDDTWQHWDAYQGGDALVWSNRGSTLGIAPQSAPASYKDIFAVVDDIMVTGFVINQGSGNQNTLSYVDNVGFAKKGEPCSIDNFEPPAKVVAPNPSGTVTGQCVASPGTGAEAVVNATNPAPTAPNTVTTDATVVVKDNGTTVHTEVLAPGASLTNYKVPFAEDSGVHVVQLFDVTDPNNPVLLDSATVDSNCADDVVATPDKLTPTPPTCFDDGKPPVPAGGLHYTSTISAPSGNGPWTYTITNTADAGYTFAGGKTYTYVITVLPKLVDNCGLAYTGAALNASALPLAGGLVAAGLVGLWWQRRKVVQA